MIKNLEFILRPSKGLLSVSVILHLVAFFAIWMADIGVWIQLGLSLLLLMMGADLIWRKLLMHHSSAIVRIWFSGSEWVIFNRHGEAIPMELMMDHWVGHCFIILSFSEKANHRRKRIFICRDSVNVQSFRQLKMMLLLDFFNS